MKTKKVTITLTEQQQSKAKNDSKAMFGRANISGFIAYLIENFKTKNK